jgi:hypothetical protein
MRLRPDTSQSARQGRADALAAFSLAGPASLPVATLVAQAQVHATLAVYAAITRLR